jgi:hypothetical protein
MPLDVALFVEGSTWPETRLGEPLHRIWNENLADVLGLRRFSVIVPISKTHLVAMDPVQPKMSGAYEGLDALIARMLRRVPFDAAVVAWDLHPRWNPDGDYCRWQETLDLYRLLSESELLPNPWKHAAGERHAELAARATPDARQRPCQLSQGTIATLCMQPMFEVLLTQNEQCVRESLGVTGRQIRDWPARGWGDATERQPDRRVLAPSIRALRSLTPRPRVTRQVLGDFVTHKAEWDEILLRNLLQRPDCRALVLQHPIARRLYELLTQNV